VSDGHTYRCLGCLEGAVTRAFDVSHLLARCPDCDSFERLVNGVVLDQFEAFEADPPAALDWTALDRRAKLLVSERVARRGRSVAEIAGDDAPAGSGSEAEPGA
jgi:hypothetical protein